LLNLKLIHLYAIEKKLNMSSYLVFLKAIFLVALTDIINANSLKNKDREVVKNSLSLN